MTTYQNMKAMLLHKRQQNKNIKAFLDKGKSSRQVTFTMHLKRFLLLALNKKLHRP